jgi:hypothetical protein
MLMQEADVATAPAAAPVSGRIDARGWPAVIVLMLVVGLLAWRPSPAPDVPTRIAIDQGASWMAEALPGIGPRTRELRWQQIRAGELHALPQRAGVLAAEVFIWPAPPPTTPGMDRPVR